MSELLRRNHSYFHLLAHSPLPKQNKFLLMTATPEQVHAICELCYNVLKESVPSSDAQWNRLQPNEDELCNLIDTKVPFKEKKKIINQTGAGFIEDVISPLLSGLSVILL